MPIHLSKIDIGVDYEDHHTTTSSMCGLLWLYRTLQSNVAIGSMRHMPTFLNEEELRWEVCTHSL